MKVERVGGFVLAEARDLAARFPPSERVPGLPISHYRAVVRIEQAIERWTDDKGDE